MREPLLLPLAAIACGILLGRALDFSVVDAAWPTAAFALLACAAQIDRSREIARLGAMLALLFAGVFTEAWHRPGPPPEIDAGPGETLVLEGCVVETSVFSTDREQFTLELEPWTRARVTLPLDMEVGAAAPRLHYGQRVEIDARIRRPRNFRNPGAFDYERYLARRHIYWTASMRGGTVARVLPGRCGSRAWATLFGLREAALDRLETLYPDDGNGASKTQAMTLAMTLAMMRAILLGENSKLEKVWTENFRRTGTIHALVISGAHVAVLAGVLLFFLRFCTVREIPALAAAAAGAWLYALVTGFSPPVARAAAGFTLYLVARFFFRKARVLNVLAAIAILFLLVDPGELLDPRFQLSFLAAGALGALGAPLIEARMGPLARGLRDVAATGADPHLEPRVAQLRVEVRLAAEAIQLWTGLPARWLTAAAALLLRAAFYAGEMFVLSAVMQIGLALPMVQYFHRVSFTGLTANLVIVPLLETAVPVGFAAIFTGWRWLAQVAGWLLKITARTAEWHAAWEPSTRVADPPVWLALGVVASLIALGAALRHRRRRGLASGIVATLFGLLLWHPFEWQRTPGTLEMTVIDVGQGDSILMVFPGGGTMLVDGGGILRYGRRAVTPRLDTGEDVVSPYLWSRGIRRIDILVATHAHADHSGGIPALLANFRPTELWLGANPSAALLEQAARLGVRVVAMRAPGRREFSGARIEVLSPPRDLLAARGNPAPGGAASGNAESGGNAAGGHAPGNNDSLVLRVAFGQRSFLLTGDMERAIELRLLRESAEVAADVLKVGHHGSRTSTTREFLEAVSPSAAVISAGFQNSFGHPHADVLDRLAARGVTLLRTDTGGLATVRTDGRKLWLDTMLWNPRGLAPTAEIQWGQDRAAAP